MFYLIGLNHCAQAKAAEAELTPEQTALAKCLTTAIEQVQPALIAEEDSGECLELRGR